MQGLKVSYKYFYKNVLNICCCFELGQMVSDSPTYLGTYRLIDSHEKSKT